MNLLDTRQKSNNLTGTLIADLVLQIFAYVAQTEREYIHQRQAEGIAAAKLKGKHLGRKPISMPEGFEKACKKCIEGIFTIRQAADSIGVSYTTFYRNYQKYKKSGHFYSKGRHLETYEDV